MLKVDHLCFRYSRHGSHVLNGVNLELKQGEIGIFLEFTNRIQVRYLLMKKNCKKCPAV